MKFSKMIFVLTIAASAIFIFTMGSSYAYYTATATDIDVTTGTIDNGVSVIFSDNNYVSIKNGVPLNDDQVEEYAKTNVFSLIPDSAILNGYDTYVNISLTNIKIDDALRVSDFKYSLTCNENVVGSGDGTSIATGKDLIVGSMNSTLGTFNINTNYQCSFRVWIANNDNVSQNELMNKKFSALLKVNTIMRKQ